MKHISCIITLRRWGMALVWLLPAYLSVGSQEQYSFRHLNIENGLSSNNVTALLKDSEGYLWIGTDNGLNRYDGYSIKVYLPKKNVPNSILTNDIWELQEDGSHHLWIRSDLQHCVYNHDKDNFTTNIPSYLQRIGIHVNRQYRVYIDKRKNIWVLQNQYLYYYEFSSQTLKSFKTGCVFNNLSEIGISDDGEKLYIFWDSTLLILRSANKEIKRINNFGKSLPSVKTNRIFIDHHGGIWLYSNYNEVLFHKKNMNSVWHEVVLHSVMTSGANAIRHIADDKNGHIWIVTDHKGVFIYDYVNDHLVNLLKDPVMPTSLSSNRINAICCDDTGVFWLGHFKKGISYTHTSFNGTISTNNQECGDISSILEDKSGNIWLGTDGNGLFVKEKQKNFALRKLPIPDIAIVCLVEDKKGRIWAGSYRDGLFVLENNAIRHFTKENSKLPYNTIWTLKEDRYGNMWVGCVNRTLACLDPETLTSKTYLQPGGNDIKALDIFYDGGDKLYIGTAYGLCVLDITTSKTEMFFFNLKGTQSFKQYYISTLYKDDRDILWMAHKQGLTAWDMKNDSLMYFDTDNGLCDNLVKTILQDNYKNMWFSTSNGLSVMKVDKNVQGELKYSFNNLSTKDGLSENCFNFYSSCKLSNGDLLFGEANGYTYINPNKISEKKRPLAKVYFTNLTIGNEIIEVDSIYKGRKLLTKVFRKTKNLSLRYDDNLVTIEFAAGDLLNSDKIKYAYKLENLNSQWYYTTDNKVIFNTLPPGRYKLLVKACNSDGIWNDEVTALNISVSPPLYLSNWAKILYLLAVIGLIVLWAFWQKRRQQTRLIQQRVKMEQEQKVLLNEMKLKFFTNISHDLRTPLTLILSPIQMLLNETRDEGVRKKLNTVNKNAQQLLSLINSLLDFRKIDAGVETLSCKTGDIVSFIRELCESFQDYALEHSIQYSVMNEETQLIMPFDPVKIKKVMNNLLSNAFKYTPDKGEVNVLIYCEDDHVCICVADNGEGIADKDKPYIFERFYQVSQTQEKTGSGIGLHIATEYVHLHHGTITVSDNIPHGAVFTVKIPVTNDVNETEGTDIDQPFETQSDHEDLEVQIEKSHYTILLVDDNKDFCSFMAEYLSDEYSVLTAHNGAEALKVIEKNEINIVISDIMMPVMNGTELCRQIKNNLHWSHIPVILLTARMAEEWRNEGFEQGADDYIIKPFDFNILKLRIKKFIEWTEKSHRTFSQKLEVTPSEITITPLDEQLITKAIKIVEEYMSDSDFSVEKLGEELGLSRSYLYRKLMLITGKGPADFIRTIRLKRSKQLLGKSQKQIAEIAYEVGFNSPKRFTISFKKEFGISPSDYLRSLKT